MSADLYRLFAEYMLSDLAERRDQSGARLERGRRREEYVSGEKHRVPLRGEHVSYGGEERFRDSDGSVRLVLAVTAYEKAYELEHPSAPLRSGKQHGAHAWACRMVAQMILGGSPLRRRFLKGRRGPKPKVKRAISTRRPGVAKAERRYILQNEVHDPRFEQIDALIAPKYARANRTIVPPEVRRLAAIIRSQVGDFRDEYKRECDQQFDASLVAFRAAFYRDAEWYAEQEQNYKLEIARLQEHLAAAESGRRPRVPWNMPAIEWNRLKAANICPTAADVALRFVNLALLYHERGEYTDAETCYCRATELYRSASVAAQLQQIVLPWINTQIDNCRRFRRPDPAPVIDCRHQPEDGTSKGPNPPNRSDGPVDQRRVR